MTSYCTWVILRLMGSMIEAAFIFSVRSVVVSPSEGAEVTSWCICSHSQDLFIQSRSKYFSLRMLQSNKKWKLCLRHFLHSCWCKKDRFFLKREISGQTFYSLLLRSDFISVSLHKWYVKHEKVQSKWEVQSWPSVLSGWRWDENWLDERLSII